MRSHVLEQQVIDEFRKGYYPLEIVERLKLPRSNVYRILHQYNLCPPWKHRATKTFTARLARAEKFYPGLFEALLVQSNSYADLARHYHTTKTTLYRWRMALDIPKRKSGRKSNAPRTAAQNESPSKPIKQTK